MIKRGKDGNDRVLSLAKLKTLEYRLFRKMREKLRGFYPLKDQEQTRSKHEVIKKFKREAQELAEEQELPRPLEYYIQLFTLAFDFLDSNRAKNVQLLHDEYVTFSEQLLAYFSSKDDGKQFANQSSFFYSDVLDQQAGITYGSGQQTQVDTSKYAVAPEIKYKAPTEQNHEESKDSGSVGKPESKRIVYFIVPFATPNSGKSFCWKAVQDTLAKDGWTFDSISSDGIRGQLIKKTMAETGCDRDAAYQKT